MDWTLKRMDSRKLFVLARICLRRISHLENLLFDLRFPYRIVFAVATQDAVYLYDTQQMEPFAYVSQIHYTRLTDVSWSSDGRLLIIASTDGYCTFVTFAPGELGVPYDGPKYQYEPKEVRLEIFKRGNSVFY